MSTPQSTPSRGRRSSPSTTKQGPLKATIPISSVLKQNSNLMSDNNSPSSPTSYWKTRFSPEHSSGQRSPGSGYYKAKSKTLNSATNNGSIMRRTVSLDTIYLKGHWPRDQIYWHTGTLHVDKSTQTEDPDSIEAKKIHTISEHNEEKLEKYLARQRLRSSKESNKSDTSSSSSQTNTSLLSPTQNPNPLSIPLKPLSKPSIRSSIEGLNQEIERLVLKSSLSGSFGSDRSEEYDKFIQMTPEGHRAPLPDLFRNTRSRSVNTQTPGEGDPTGSCQLSEPPSRESLSPFISLMDEAQSDTGGSQGSSPDQDKNKMGASPHINKFLAREPPDGCEKVHLKSYDEMKFVPLEHPQPPSTFKLKPSLGSAFKILQPGLSLSATSPADRDSPVAASSH